MKNEIKQHPIDRIMDIDRGNYYDCMKAIARLMDEFDILIEFQPNFVLEMHDALRSALKECNSDDNDQFLSLSEIDEVTKKKPAQWHKNDEKREDFLYGDCGNCHGCEDDFEDCK